MPAQKDFYWFGVKKLEIATRPATVGAVPTWVHVPSIEQAAVRASASEVKVYGDDTLQYTFVHSPESQLAVKLTKFSGKVAEMLTGNAAMQASGKESMYIFTNKDLNPPILMARVTMPARDDDTGAAQDLTMVFFKITARPIWDNFGSERGKATELNWTFDIIASDTDERGVALPNGIDFAMGRYDFHRVIK